MVAVAGQVAHTWLASASLRLQSARLSTNGSFAAVIILWCFSIMSNVCNGDSSATQREQIVVASCS